MTSTGPDIDLRFRILGIYLNRHTNQQWAELLRYSEASSVSRIRTGKMPLTEEKIRLICEACDITRREFDLPHAKLIERLEIEDKVPRDLVESGTDFLNSDLDLIRQVSGEFMLLYPGRDYATGDMSVVITEKITVDKDTFGGSFSNTKNILMHDNFITNTSSLGKISAIGGVLYLSFEYPDHPFPPSTFLLEVLAQGRSITILTGLYLDVTGEARRRIFSTQCCMFNCDKGFELPRTMTSDHPLHERWMAAMDNQVAHRKKLLAKHGEDLIEELSSLVLATRG